MSEFSEKKKNNVANLMQSKKYFYVGFHWYFDRYLGFFWQKRLFMYLFFITFIAIIYLYYTNSNILIDSRIEIPVITYIDNYNDIAFIKKLQSKETNNPNILMSNYLVEKYVINRESYDYQNIEFQRKFLFNNSTSFLYMDYDQYMSVSNSLSPLLLYGKYETLNPKIKKIDITLDNGGLPTKAGVIFEIYKKSTKEEILLSSNKVEMEFFMTDIFSINENQKNTSQSEFSNFIFSVLRYKSYKKG